MMKLKRMEKYRRRMRGRKEKRRTKKSKKKNDRRGGRKRVRGNGIKKWKKKVERR